MTSLLLLAAFTLAQAAPPLELSLPPGPAAEFMRAEPGPAPELPPPHEVPAWSSPAWREAAPWASWEAALASPDSPTARLELMRTARALGRSQAAWSHFTLLPRAWAESVLPELLVAPHTDAEGTLVLRPLLPPEPVFDRELWTGMPPKRIYSATGLEFEGTRFSLGVEVAPEGIEVRVKWEAGPARKARVVIPTPDDWKARLVYVDWDRTDLDPEGYELQLGPPVADEEAELVLWARCEAERRTWPQLAGSQFPAKGMRLEFHTTLEFHTSRDDPEFGRLTQAAAFVTELLGLEVTVVADKRPGTPLPATHSPLIIDLSPGDQRDLKLRDLVTQTERVALARRVVEIPRPR